MHNTAAIETINFQDQIRIQSQWIGWLRRKWLAVVAVATKTTTFIATFEKKFQRSSLWIQFSPTLSYSHHHWMSINLPTFIHNMYESIYPIWTSVRVCAPSCVCVCVFILVILWFCSPINERVSLCDTFPLYPILSAGRFMHIIQIYYYCYYPQFRLTIIIVVGTSSHLVVDDL